MEPGECRVMGCGVFFVHLFSVSSPIASSDSSLLPSVVSNPAAWHVGRLHAQPRSTREHVRPFILRIADTISLPENSCFLKTQHKAIASGVWATYASYDLLHRLYIDREINYAKLWSHDQRVKPYAWFCFPPADKPLALGLLRQSVAHLRGMSDVFSGDFDILEKIACTGVEEAFDYDEYVLIWNNKRHFASASTFLQFVQQVQLHNGLRQYGGYAGAPAYAPRAALPFPGSVDRCMLNSFGSDVPSAYPGWRPHVEEYVRDCDGFKRFCVTAIHPESVEIPVAGAGRRDQAYVSVETLQNEGFREKILSIAKSHHPGFRIDRVLLQGVKYLVFFTIDGFEGFRCPRGVDHSKGFLQAVYDTSGIATFRCMNTGDDCDDFAVGISSKAEDWRRWSKTFDCIVEMCCNRPDFPISEEQCNIYGMRELKEFYTRRALGFDFDADFGFHPVGDARQMAVGWNYEFVEKLLEDGGLDRVIDYLNLFIGILPQKKLVIRTLGSFYRTEQLQFLKDAIAAPLTYTIVDDRSGKKTKKSILKEWQVAQRHAIFLGSFPTSLSIWNFVDWSTNLNTLTLPAINRNRARAAVYQTGLNDINFHRYMRETALEFWCLAEAPLQREKTKDLLDSWVGRLLFQIAEPIHVMCVLDSKEGGTGKSTLGDFLAKGLQPQNVHSTDMWAFMSESFNSELCDRLLIRFDDVAKEALTDKKFELLAGFMKQRLTESDVTTKAKFGSNSTSRKVISNFFACGNGSDIPGINPEGTERRIFICPVGDLDQQTRYLKDHPFKCGDSDCPNQSSGCRHNVTTARQFWALFNNLFISPGHHFDAMVGLWLEAFELRDDNDVQMHLLLQETTLVQQQKEKRTEPVIKWWRDCVKLGRLFDSQDRRELQKITLVLPTHDTTKQPPVPLDPNDHADDWLSVMGVVSLHKIFQRNLPGTKMTLEDFERTFGGMMEKISPLPARSQMKCYLWTYQQEDYGINETWKWRRTTKDSAEYFVYTLPKVSLKPKAVGASDKEQKDVRDSILKWSISQPLHSLANVASGLDRPIHEVSSSVSFSQFDVDHEMIESEEPEDGEILVVGHVDDEDAQDGMDNYVHDSFVASDEEIIPGSSKKRGTRPVTDDSPTKQHKGKEEEEEEDEVEIYLTE